MSSTSKKAAPAAAELELQLKAMNSALCYVGQLAEAGSKLMAIAQSGNVEEGEFPPLQFAAGVLFDVAGHVAECTVRAAGDPGWKADPAEWLLPYGTRELLQSQGGAA